MFQIKCTGGNEIRVIGKGEKAPCEVIGSNGEVKFVGTYEKCLAWCAERAIKTLG